MNDGRGIINEGRFRQSPGVARLWTSGANKFMLKGIQLSIYEEFQQSPRAVRLWAREVYFRT